MSKWRFRGGFLAVGSGEKRRGSRARGAGLLAAAVFTAGLTALIVAGTPAKSGAETLQEALKDIRGFWHLRLQRFRYSPTSPAAVWKGFYLESGQVLILDRMADAEPEAKVSGGPTADGGELAIEYRDGRFRLVRSTVAIEKMVGWDGRKAQAEWTPVDTAKDLAPGGYRAGDRPFHLSLHPPYGRVLVFRRLRERPAPIEGFQRFPVDLSFRLRVRLIPEPTSHEVQVETSRGLQARMKKVGMVEFEYRGSTYQLEAYRDTDTGPDELFIIYRDATTGKTTYPVGRYLEAVRLSGNTFLMDFNKSYLPLCAYSHHYNCPVPPRANELPFPVTAGEKNPSKSQAAH